MREYTIVVTPDLEEGGFIVTVPALPGCVTQGETFDEALERAQEAVEGHIEALKAIGAPVPDERAEPRITTISVAAD